MQRTCRKTSMIASSLTLVCARKPTHTAHMARHFTCGLTVANGPGTEHNTWTKVEYANKSPDDVPLGRWGHSAFVLGNTLVRSLSPIPAVD
jgi:hypothetical protein